MRNDSRGLATFRVRAVTTGVILGLLLATSGARVAGESLGPEVTVEARRLAQAGHPQEALSLLDRYLDKHPEGDDEASFLKGWILFSQMKAYKDAMEIFQTMQKMFPQSRLADDALYYSGFIAQYYLKDNTRAAELYRRGYLLYPQGDFRYAIADKLTQLEGSTPKNIPPEPVSNVPGVVMDAKDTSLLSILRRRAAAADTGVKAEKPATIVIQFENAPLKTFIQWVAEVTGRNFIIDDDVTGNITVYSGKPVPFAEVYRIFLSILEVKGFAAIEAEGVTKIVVRSVAAQSELPIVIDDDAPAPTDRLITRIFRLKNLAAASVQGLIRPFLAGGDQVVVNAETNNLVVTGHAANIARIADLIRLVDAATVPVSLRSHRISFGRAATIADKLNQLVMPLAAAPGVPVPPLKIVPDERTNTIHVIAPDGLHFRIVALVEELDVDKTAQRLVKVFNLSYARADDVAKQLKSLLGLDAVDNAADVGGVIQTVLIADQRLNAVSISTFAPRVVDLVDSYIKHVDRPPSTEVRQTKIVRLQNAMAVEMFDLLTKIFAPAASTTDAFSLGLADRIIMSPDQRTNSLIITATNADWGKLDGIIKDLDVRKAQVLVDAVILETSLEEARLIGASITTADQPLPGHTRILGGSAIVPTDQLSQGGLLITAVRGTTVGPLLQALLTSAKTDVLQMPQVLALDNEQATINVGDLTPIVSSRSVSGTNVQISGSSSIFQNVEYKNIGLNLKLKPHIGEKGDILLELSLEVQNRGATSEVGLPVFTNRAIESKIQITDGDYIILGGLLRTQDRESQRKTPWLSKIPVLGVLFTNTRAQEEKTVLLIFLRPRVVTDPRTAGAITDEERKQFDLESKIGPGAQRSETEKWLPR